MKKINLITALPIEKQYAIKRWFCMTAFLFVCAMMVASYFIVPNIITYRCLKKESAALVHTTKEHALLASTKETLKKEYDELHAREAKINNYKQQKKNPYSHIAEIVQLCGKTVELESIKLNKKEIEIELVSSTAESIRSCIKSLSASTYFSHIKMVSLQQDAQNKKVRCAVKGHVVF
jgi:Tfp pilus assembly protein PilN